MKKKQRENKRERGKGQRRRSGGKKEKKRKERRKRREEKGREEKRREEKRREEKRREEKNRKGKRNDEKRKEKVRRDEKRREDIRGEERRRENRRREAIHLGCLWGLVWQCLRSALLLNALPVPLIRQVYLNHWKQQFYLHGSSLWPLVGGAKVLRFQSCSLLSFGITFGSIFESFWCHFGITFEVFLSFV